MRKLLSAASTAAVVAGGLVASAGGAVPASAAPAPPGRAAATAEPGGLTSVTPTRLFDGTAGGHGRVTVQVAGRGGVPARGVAAVLLNLTARATAAGSLVAHPHGSAVPGLASVSFAAGAAASSLVTVPLGSGAVDVDNRSTGSVVVTADVVGYYRSGGTGTGGAFSPVTPARVGPSSLAAKAVTTVRVAGVAGVPQHGAAAVLLNLTASGPSGHVVAYRHGAVQPPVGELTLLMAAAPVSTQVIVQVGEDGSIDLFDDGAGAGSLAAHVVGFFRAGAAVAPGTFADRYPRLLLDPGAPVLDPLPPGMTADVFGGDEWPLPVGAIVVYSVNVPDPDSSGALTLFPQGGPEPAVPTVTFSAGHPASSLVAVPAGERGVTEVRNEAGSTVSVFVTEVGFHVDGTAGAIAGTVTDSAGHPLEGVTLNASVNTFLGPAATGPDGGYTLSGVAPGDSYPVCFDPATSRGTRSPLGDLRGCFGSPDGSTPTPITVRPGEVTANIDQQLAMAGGVSGRVTDPAGQPLGNVAVFGPTERTAADGTYRVVGVRPGTLQICFSADGPVTGGTSTTGYLRDCDKTVEVRAGQITTQDEQLPLAAAISGRVTDSAGNPLAGVIVDLFPSHQDEPVAAASFGAAATGADGTYRLTALSPDTYHVCFSPQRATGGASTTGYVGECFPDTLPPAIPPGGDPITLGNGDERTGVDASLETGGAVTGQALTPDGQPLGEVDVGTRIGDVFEGFAQVFGPDRSYRLDGLRAGPHSVCFILPPGPFAPVAPSCVDVTVVPGQVVEHVDGQAS